MDDTKTCDITRLPPLVQGDRISFMMANFPRCAAVVDWLTANSYRPQQATRLWMRCLVIADWSTGEVLSSRQGMARDLGITPDDVSRIMGELVKTNALIRRRIDGHNHYFVNPRVGTNLTGAARTKAQKDAPELTCYMPESALAEAA